MSDTTSRPRTDDPQGDPPGPPRRVSRRALIGAAAGGAVLLAGAAVGSVAVFDLPGDGGDVRAAPTPTAPLPTPTTPAGIGVFRGTDAEDVRAFEAWAGQPMQYVVDFSSRDTWQEIADPSYMIEEWQATPYRVVYAVALLPYEEDGVTMEAGAAGEYNDVFGELAQHLVDAGQEDAVLRLGWEFNIESSGNSTEDPQVFIDYWRNVVETMRSVPGQEFAFDWNPNNSTNEYDAAEYYPGDDVVDVIGIDVYDTSWKDNTYPYPDGCDAACRTKRQDRAWNEDIYGGERGLLFWATFAADHGKPMSLPEWGLWERPDGHGGGENPTFIRRMHEFITTNNVLYQAYFEYSADDGTHLLSKDFPASGEVYRSLFGTS